MVKVRRETAPPLKAAVARARFHAPRRGPKPVARGGFAKVRDFWQRIVPGGRGAVPQRPLPGHRRGRQTRQSCVDSVDGSARGGEDLVQDPEPELLARATVDQLDRPSQSARIELQ